MKFGLFVAVSAFALASVPAPADAQNMNMPGMAMPMPAKKGPPRKPTAKKISSTRTKGAPKKVTAKKAAPKHGHQPSAKGVATPMDQGPTSMPQPQSRSGSTMPMNHSQMQHGTMPTQPQAGSQGSMSMSTDQQHGDKGQTGQMNMPTSGHGRHEMGNMTGAFGSYPMERESSGTAWQPDLSEHVGLMEMSGDWTLMAHGVLNLVYSHQSGPRGDDKAFASGMLMGMARRPLGNGALQLRASMSPDPLMGPSGYPLLLASGETANGRDRLIDRQHPHDFVMELSASASQNLGRNSSVFLYTALPGEPAFGPSAFMHREAILDSPEAPISHHWLDSTHISFGVITAGLVLDRVKLEVSRFNGREPDQHRWNIETGPLDSTAVRVSWNPTTTLALQGSWGHFTDPEQLEPGVDQKRLSASALYAREIAPGWKLAATLAWGRKTVEDHNDDAFATEASLKHDAWTLFGRAEMTENRELVAGVENGPAYRVGKVSLGTVRDFRIAEHLSIGVGGLLAVNFVPSELAPLYGGNNPTGAMGFVRLKLR